MESGSGTIIGWTVEARYVCDGAIIVGGQTFDQKWRRVHFPEGRFGVPRGAIFQEPWLKLTGRYSYEAAQALRWWLYVEREKRDGMGTLCLETRLVRHKISFEFDVKPDGAGHVADESNYRNVNSEKLADPETASDPEPADD